LFRKLILLKVNATHCQPGQPDPATTSGCHMYKYSQTGKWMYKNIFVLGQPIMQKNIRLRA